MKVSACIITYNHEGFIRECLDGAINQLLNCEYEIVIGDDCSSDKTSIICEDYAKKHPDIIHYFRRKENLGMMGNWLETIKNCSGEYIALCEGDDYWTDPYKLQKQVDFFEAHEKYVICSHETLVTYENSNEECLFSQKNGNAFFGQTRNRFIIQDTFKGWFIHTSSLVFRNKYQIPNNVESPNADMFLISFLSQFGDIGFINEIMSVYRNNTGGITHSKAHISYNYLYNHIKTYLEVKRYLPSSYHNQLNKEIARLYFQVGYHKFSNNELKKEYLPLIKNAIDLHKGIILKHPFKLATLCLFTILPLNFSRVKRLKSLFK